MRRHFKNSGNKYVAIAVICLKDIDEDKDGH